MARHVGKLPPRYTFVLNPHVHSRMSACPKCRRLTYPRKFAFFVHVNGYGAMIQGKTCKYCPRCEWIICHQDELETQLALSFAMVAPTRIGSDYLVLGTIDIKYFKANLLAPGGDSREHMADFKKHQFLNRDPGGWRGPDSAPHIITNAEVVAGLSTPWKQRTAKSVAPQ